MTFHTNIIKECARERHPAIYVGLGICGGETFRAVLPHVVGSAYACDIDKGCVSSTEPGNPKTHFYGMSTDDFAEVWKNEIGLEIDMIFIDACHAKENVIRDAVNFYPYLKKDTGIMFLHDTWPPNMGQTRPDRCGDAYLAKKPLMKLLEDAEMATLPCQYGLSVIRKVSSDWRNG